MGARLAGRHAAGSAPLPQRGNEVRDGGISDVGAFAGPAPEVSARQAMVATGIQPCRLPLDTQLFSMGYKLLAMEGGKRSWAGEARIEPDDL
jgi:hypothetical protein